MKSDFQIQEGIRKLCFENKKGYIRIVDVDYNDNVHWSLLLPTDMSNYFYEGTSERICHHGSVVKINELTYATNGNNHEFDTPDGTTLFINQDKFMTVLNRQGQFRVAFYEDGKFSSMEPTRNDIQIHFSKITRI